jgi:hypothetical protein
VRARIPALVALAAVALVVLAAWTGDWVAAVRVEIGVVAYLAVVEVGIYLHHRRAVRHVARHAARRASRAAHPAHPADREMAEGGPE